MRLTRLFLLLFVIGFSVQAQSQQLTLDRIFKSDDFRNERFGPARWTDGGKAYTTLEASPEYPKKRDIVEYQAKTGERSILVSASRLIPAGSNQPLDIHDYHWSNNKEILKIYTNSKRVWRDNTRGDYWILDMEYGNLKQ